MKDNGSRCRVTVDGTDFRTYEPMPFDAGNCSHKFKGPGLRYEIAICIQTGWIVSFNGPYQAGRWSDLRIFRHYLQHMLDDDEMVCTDGGYRDGKQYCEAKSGRNNWMQRMQAKARSYHEAVNGILASWGILSDTFHHDRARHGIVALALVNISQLKIKHYGANWTVQYDDGGFFPGWETF